MSSQRTRTAILTASLLSIAASFSGTAYADASDMPALGAFEHRTGMRDEYLPAGSVRTPWTVHESGFIQE